MRKKIKHLANILLVFLFLLTIAINRDGTVLGTPIQELVDEQSSVEAEVLLPDGTLQINSLALRPRIFGYSAQIPLIVSLKQDTIRKVELGEHSETGEFFDQVMESRLLESHVGLSIKDAANLQLDAITGATLTSHAIIDGMKQVIAYASKQQHASTPPQWFTLKRVMALLVITFGLTLSLLKKKNKVLRYILLGLNVLVLGLWCGSFISLSLLTSFVSNGVHFPYSLIPLVLLVSALLMPLLGKKNQYCNYHCPLGSAQELLGKNKKLHLNIPKRVSKMLVRTKDIIFLSLLFIMWAGVGFQLMEYEAFSIFLFQNASRVVIVLGSLFLLLSIFVPRPYCRYICPTGTLINFAQKTKD